MILPEVGDAGQARLARAHVLIAGAGGLGVPVLQYLAGGGVGHITLIDPDRVEETNLHRQPIYGGRTGQPKALAAQAFVQALNPATGTEAVVGRLDPANAPALVAAADLVLDCADSFAVSYILSDTCLAAGKPLISASALGMEGYAGGFCGGAPSLRAVFPGLPDTAATCATAGVLGPVVGMIGCLQAQMALAVLLGLPPSPLGQLVRFNAQGLRFSGFRFDRAPEPADPGPAFIAPGAITPGDLVIDLRDAAEAPRPVTPAAQRLRPDEVPDLHPAPGQRVVLACRSGLRAWRAAEVLRPLIPNPLALVADPGGTP